MDLGSSLWEGSVALSSLSKWALPEKLLRDQGGNLGVFPGHGTKWIHWLKGPSKAWRTWGGWILPLAPLSLRSPLQILGWAQLQWGLMLTSLLTQTGQEPSMAPTYVDVALCEALRSGPFWEDSTRSAYHPAHSEPPSAMLNFLWIYLMVRNTYALQPNTNTHSQTHTETHVCVPLVCIFITYPPLFHITCPNQRQYLLQCVLILSHFLKILTMTKEFISYLIIGMQPTFLKTLLKMGFK